MAHCIAVLDIGSSKVVCAICSRSGGRLVVHGTGICEYAGYSTDVIGETALPNEKDMAVAIKRAIHSAEHESGYKLKAIALGISGPFLKTVTMQGVLMSGNKRHIIVESDYARLRDISLTDVSIEGYELIHSSPICYIADDVRSTSLPTGTGVYTLIGKMSHVFMNSRLKRMLANILNGSEEEDAIDIDAIVSVPLAESIYMIPRQHRDVGALLVDVGYTHTDVSYVFGEALAASVVIPVGGKSFAADLSLVLEIPFDVAENMKQRFVFGIEPENSKEMVRMHDKSIKYVDQEIVQQVIEARAAELGDLIIDCVNEMGFDIDDIIAESKSVCLQTVGYNNDESEVESAKAAAMYLTGAGFAQMRGSTEFLSNYMEMSISTKIPEVSKLNSLGYTSAYAVASLLLNQKVNIELSQRKKRKTGWLSRIFG